MFVINPTVALVLIAVGLISVVWEFLRPGLIFPGVAGALLLAIGVHSLWLNPLRSQSQWMWAATLFLPLLALLIYLLAIARKARRNKRIAIS